jgi:hypothetical protein
VTEAVGVIEVEQDGKQLKLPDTAAIAARSRRTAADARQRPRREREHQARRRAADFAASAKAEGSSCRQAAKQLCIRSRTLASWCSRQRRGEMTCRPRGRPCKESLFHRRLAVAEFLRDTVPYMSIPAMRDAFPEMPRCELTDLRRDYWSVYRRHNEVIRAQLTWHSPGRVWAMDHTKPPTPVDGMYPKIFAVRDLASGMELAWQPVPDETAETTRDALLALFREHGPPLVLKSDNGGAFKAEVIQLLEGWRVTPLLSPPETPRYNGSREAGNGALKTRTHYLAHDPGFWTSDDMEAAQRYTNEYYRRRETDRTALKIWNARTAIDDTERKRFLLTVRRIRSQMEETMNPGDQTAATKAAIERRVVSQALEEFGILSTKWRPITLPIKLRKCAKIS